MPELKLQFQNAVNQRQSDLDVFMCCCASSGYLFDRICPPRRAVSQRQRHLCRSVAQEYRPPSHSEVLAYWL